MRSSNKSRSRNKNNNRNRSVGNVVNRVFDSAGPEGKVRGTPQQIIEKYQALARDAQLSNDRVAAENFLQHSEHYTRLLGEAMREQAERQQEQEERQRNSGNQNQNGGQQANSGGGNNGNPGNDQPDGGQRSNNQQPHNSDDKRDTSSDSALSVEGEDSTAESGLVDTPESVAEAAPVKKPRTRTRRPAKPKEDAKPDTTAPEQTASASE
ncbi:DUF4167 domain-containing protein [Algicella marina]|uniref:DUF4167 domain-containing protein n=2 Tax=Algicella marina TaxID=2683284 RepID=A0A6P1T7N5_9RHOB|nr:DUF4167 domain-containing protein [Algicella marina]